MKLQEVNDQAAAREFLLLPVRLYKHSSRWIRPLDKDIHAVFDPERNKTHRNGEMTRWILKDDAGITVGRVAAFINRKTVNKDNDQPTGGMGFFECIDDQDVAFALFDACKGWLQARGMEAMDGPINFGDRDRWWGLLVKGFEYEPNYLCNYNFPYYQRFFENYGFRDYFGQITFARKVMDPLSPKLHEKAERIFRDPKYTFRHLEMKEIERYTEYFHTIYNKAWASHKGVPQLSLQVAKHIMKQMKPVMDPKIMWYGFYGDDPIAFFIMLPEVNQIFKHLNGRLDLIGKLKFLYHQKRGTCRKMFGTVFGIVPEHQGKGVEGALIESVRRLVQGSYRKYDDFEMNWIGDFNHKMIHVAEQVGGYRSKIHTTYRLLFDPDKPFRRHPVIGGGEKRQKEE